MFEHHCKHQLLLLPKTKMPTDSLKGCCALNQDENLPPC